LRGLTGGLIQTAVGGSAGLGGPLTKRSAKKPVLPNRPPQWLVAGSLLSFQAVIDRPGS